MKKAIKTLRSAELAAAAGQSPSAINLYTILHTEWFLKVRDLLYLAALSY